MNLDQLTEVGRIKRAHGLNGELKFNFDSYYYNDLAKIDVLVLQKGDSYLPFFVDSIQLNSTNAIVKFESVNDKETATQLNGKLIFALSDQLSSVKENEIDTLVGMQLFDQENTLIGSIDEVVEMPNQILLVVEYKGNEVMIPFHEDLILQIIETENKIQVEIPDGLLEIFS